MQVTAAQVVPEDIVPPDAAVFFLLLFLAFRSQYLSVFDAQRPFQSRCGRPAALQGWRVAASSCRCCNVVLHKQNQESVSSNRIRSG